MTDYHIPSDLISLLISRRVIPFIGSGFSASLNVPTWDKLLLRLAEDLEDSLSFDKISAYCNNDPLQIAEYFFLTNDNSIGPLRHVISNSLHSDVNPVSSGIHVDLINLNQPIIYTTNYDDYIEMTFKELGIHCDVIVLPKHVANISGDKTQIIKFHGDLRHDESLVLTESSYYARLDLETPIDIKFRSDLLGKSVLFMGYSFRDINIRIIWFKLMNTMKDIPIEDRNKSYIVRFSPNPILEKLYSAVGIETIVLNPKYDTLEDRDRIDLFNEFLFDLSSKLYSSSKFRKVSKHFFVSSSLISNAIGLVPHGKERQRRISVDFFSLAKTIRHIAEKDWPVQLRDEFKLLLRSLSDTIMELKNHIIRFRQGEFSNVFVKIAVKYLELFELIQPVATIIVLSTLIEPNRKYLHEIGSVWKEIWKFKISNELVDLILTNFKKEIQFHQSGRFDKEIFFYLELIARISAGQLVKGPDKNNYKEKASHLFSQASGLHNAVKDFQITADGITNIDHILESVEGINEDTF